MLQSWFDARAVGVSTGGCIMVFQDDGVLPKTKTMARAQYTHFLYFLPVSRNKIVPYI